jgi:hypothetical protein
VRLSLALLVALVASSARAETVRHDLASERSERLTCSIAAALKYGVPTNIMLAVAEIEGGRPGLRVPNRNGSFDIGPLQFNTRYLEHLGRRFGITAADVAAAGCYPYELAAWRLRKHLELDAGDAWTRAANYHSRNAIENSKYRHKLISKAAVWARWLAERLARHEVSGKVVRSTSHTAEISNSHAHTNDRDEEDSEFAALLEQLDDDTSVGQPRRIEFPSSGEAHVGSRLAGVQLLVHPGYKLIDASRSWGTRTTINWLTAAFNDVVAADPAAPRVEVHDLSLRFGGRMAGHKSHQNGRDVDITYYQRRSGGICAGRRVRAVELDALREWRLLRHWLERSQAEFIFIDYALQRPLYEAAKTSGATERQLAEWFQYPRGASVRVGIIRHVPNHADHVHVRFHSSSSSGPRAETPFDENSEGALLDLLEE